jgi:hypothetical protein
VPEADSCTAPNALPLDHLDREHEESRCTSSLENAPEAFYKAARSFRKAKIGKTFFEIKENS